MKCEQCGSTLSERRGEVEIDEGGVIIKLEGVRIFECPNGDPAVHAIPKMEALFHRVALELARKPQRLMPEEIRFLRKHLGLSSREFARKMGVDHTTVSKWERRDQPQDMGRTTERLLRLLVLTERPIEEYPLEEMASQEATPIHPIMRLDAQGWHPRAA
jgi:putative zinc finger/helix-turn-helix YgiT family protein